MSVLLFEQGQYFCPMNFAGHMCLFEGGEIRCWCETAELISFADMVPGSPPKDSHSVRLGPEGGQSCCAAPVDLGWIYLISKKQAFVPLSLLRFEEDSFKQRNLVYHDRFIY